MSVMLTREKPGGQPDWRQRLIETLLSMPEPPARPKITYEEFLAWADEDTLAEWVDGEVDESRTSCRTNVRHLLQLGPRSHMKTCCNEDELFGESGKSWYTLRSVK